MANGVGFTLGLLVTVADGLLDGTLVGAWRGNLVGLNEMDFLIEGDRVGFTEGLLLGVELGAMEGAVKEGLMDGAAVGENIATLPGIFEGRRVREELGRVDRTFKTVGLAVGTRLWASVG